jgi:hypothetical protein
MFVLYGVFMLCYFCVIACTESNEFLLREVKELKLQKASDTHSSTYFYYCISFF